MFGIGAIGRIGRGDHQAAPFVGALDAVAATPASAYSTRRLRASYYGPALRVRRASDNAEQDIGFTPANVLDTAALLAFTGVGSGFDAVWYDQFASAQHATQTTAGSQPRVVDAGAIETINGRPALRFNPGYLQSFTSGAGLTGASVAAVFVRGNGFGQRQMFDWRSVASDNPLLDDSATGGFGFRMRNDATQLVGTPNIGGDSNPHVYSAIWNQSTLDFRLEGGSSVTANISGVLTLDRLGIGSNGRTFGVNIFDGLIAELILFPSALSAADRRSIERNQGAHYGITVA